jgi:ParB-like chromosome segregation protein Spo0J
MPELVAHELASFFPPLDAEDFKKLKADLKEHGLIHPITLYEDKVLDGWHRYRACLAIGIKPKFETFHRNGMTPLDFVVSENVMRRHLSNGQRAVLATKLARKYEAETTAAEEARKAKIGQKPTQFQRAEFGPLGKSADRAAKALHVGKTSVKEVKFIEKHAAKAGLNPQKELEDISQNKKTIHAVAERVRHSVAPRKEVDRSAATCAHCEVHCPIRYTRKGKS